MSHDEIRHLRAVIGSENYRYDYDIFGNLPLEVSQEISKYLELYQIFQAQRVVKRWEHILSSTHVIDSRLGTWFSESTNVASIGLKIPKTIPPRGRLSMEAAHVDAFRSGSAFSMALGELEVEDEEDFLAHTDYNGGILAWMSADRTAVKLKCLASGRQTTLNIPNHKRAGRLCISDSIVAVFTGTDDSTWYAWDLAKNIEETGNKNPHHLELPNWRVAFYFVMGNTIAVSSRTYDGYTMMVWDIDRLAFHIFKVKVRELPISGETARQFFLLCHGGKSIVFFERYTGDPGHAYFTRYNLIGEVQSQGSVEHPNVRGYTRHSEHTYLIPMNKRIPLWSYVQSDKNSPSEDRSLSFSWKILRFCYNSELDRLEVNHYVVDEVPEKSRVFADLFWWKDVAYLSKYNDDFGNVRTLDLDEGTYTAAPMSMPHIIHDWLEERSIHPTRVIDSDDSDDDQDQGEPCLFLGDEKFLVSIQPGFYVAWCFDSNVTMADEVPSYKGRLQEKKRIQYKKTKARLEISR